MLERHNAPHIDAATRALLLQISDATGHVRYNLSVFTQGKGGYVFNQVHNIQQNVSVENMEEMYSAAWELGGC